MTSVRSWASSPSGELPPIHMPLFFEAAILSRMRSPVSSRSNWAKDRSTLRVSRPLELVVFELLRDRDERDLVGVEGLDQAGKVSQSPGQPVDLVGHDHIDPAGADIGEQTLQAGAEPIAAGEPAVVIGGREREPAFVPLAEGISLAGPALRMQRDEFLLQLLLRGLVG